MRRALALAVLIAWSACVAPAAPPAELGDETPTTQPPSAAGAGPQTDPRNLTWIRRGELAIGGGGLTEADVRYLHESGFDAVANFRAEHQDPVSLLGELGVEHLYVPVVHASDINESQIRTYVGWQREMDQQGKQTYVHCQNGWHRAASFVAAYEMNTTGRSYEEVSDDATARRPGTVLRGLPALLAYEAELVGEPGLTVLLRSERSRPVDRDEAMPVMVEVLDERGRPVEGARVEVWNEGRSFQVAGLTGRDGRFHFSYEPKTTSWMSFLYARASHPGHADGADAIEVFHDSEEPAERTVHVFVTPRSGGFDAEIVGADGAPSRGRVYATTPDGAFVFDRTGTGRTFLPVTLERFPIQVHVASWGAPAARTIVAGTSEFHAAWTPHEESDWWRQVRVAANQPIQSVSVSVDGQPWQELSEESDGDWVGAVQAPEDSIVRYRAHGENGVVESPCFRDGQDVACPID